jgi:predicted metalloprotease with PDZ domain
MTSHRYRVRVLPAQHELDIELTLAVEKPTDVLHVQTPTWVPGAYGLMKYGRDLFDVHATDAVGNPLKLTRRGWSGFDVEGASGTVRIRYRAGAYDPAWGELSGLLSHEQGVLLATRYLYAPSLDGPVVVNYDVPANWEVHHPSGAGAFFTQHVWEYPSFAALLDTPVVVGAFDKHTRTVAGTPFHFVFLDRTVGYERELESFLDQQVKMIEATHAVFGSFPFKDYSFIFSFSPTAHWGLEHANATMIGLGELALIDPEARARALRVSAHELFHAWNVCRLKPEGLPGADFASAPTTDSLWIAEGVTRYYEFLLCTRSGVYSPEQFFSNVVNYFRQLESMPAYFRVSALDSSRATFLNHNKYPGSINATIDYYDKGMLIAFDLDAHLRTTSDQTLDGTFADFYGRFVQKDGGYTHRDVLEHFGRFEGARALLEREVELPAGLETSSLLERLGFEVSRETLRMLGVVLKENAQAEIVNVLDNSPAGASGLAPGDELLRLDGFPFNFKALQWLVKHQPQFKVEVKRGHQVHAFEVAPVERNRIGTLKWRGDSAQLERLRTWLGRPEWKPMPGQSLPLSSFENFHGIQAVL